MTTFTNFDSNQLLVNKLKVWGRYLGLIGALVGLIVVLGWCIKLKALVTFGGDLPLPILPSILLIFNGLVLFFYNPFNSSRLGLIRVIAYILLCGLLLRIMGNFTPWSQALTDLELLTPGKNIRSFTYSGVLSFTAISVSAILFSYRPIRYLNFLLCLLFSVFTLCIFNWFFLAFRVDAKPFAGFQMSLPALFGLSSLTVGYFFWLADQGIMQNLTSTRTGSRVFRQLEIITLLLPFILGRLIIFFHESTHLGYDYGLVVAALLLFVVFTITLLSKARKINLIEDRRLKAEQNLVNANLDMRRANRRITQSNAEISALNEKIFAQNAETTAANKELLRANQALIDAKNTIEQYTKLELQRSKNQFETTLNNLPFPFTIFDENGKAKFINSAGKKVMHISKDDADPLNTYMQKLETNDLSDFLAAMREVYETRQSNTMEWLVPNFAGTKTYASYLIPVLDDKNQIAELINFGVDITERKAAEQRIIDSLSEKQILLAEIHHRVKNNMAVISGFLSLQAFTVKDPNVLAVLKESQNRILAMALVHEKLYQTENLARVDFAIYAFDLVKTIQSGYDTLAARVVVDLQIEHIYLGITHALPLGLILNELLSNSFKYAFQGRDFGSIRITLSAEEDYYKFTYSDNGIGLTPGFDFTGAKTLGLTLVRTFVKQLKGSLQMSQENGLSFAVRFKVTLS